MLIAGKHTLKLAYTIYDGSNVNVPNLIAGVRVVVFYEIESTTYVDLTRCKGELSPNFSLKNYFAEILVLADS